MLSEVFREGNHESELQLTLSRMHLILQADDTGAGDSPAAAAATSAGEDSPVTPKNGPGAPLQRAAFATSPADSDGSSPGGAQADNPEPVICSEADGPELAVETTASSPATASPLGRTEGSTAAEAGSEQGHSGRAKARSTSEDVAAPSVDASTLAASASLASEALAAQQGAPADVAADTDVGGLDAAAPRLVDDTDASDSSASAETTGATILLPYIETFR